jgi:hypothetical protein
MDRDRAGQRQLPSTHRRSTRPTPGQLFFLMGMTRWRVPASAEICARRGGASDRCAEHFDVLSGRLRRTARAFVGTRSDARHADQQFADSRLIATGVIGEMVPACSGIHRRARTLGESLAPAAPLRREPFSRADAVRSSRQVRQGVDVAKLLAVVCVMSSSDHFLPRMRQCPPPASKTLLTSYPSRRRASSPVLATVRVHLADSTVVLNLAGVGTTRLAGVC